MHNNYYNAATTPHRGQVGGDMNHLYLSPAQQQASRPGMFLKRNERIDWRRIAAVDVDRIARDMDFQALQDNLENITLCNIDAEIDTRVMDPNFIKLYKMSQLTIEYLLICQDQITSQLADYEQLKSRGLHDQEDTRQQIEKLKHELAETKKESKKRRKMLETQQRMLMAQNSNYHTCPVCTHAFLSVAYLQAHITRRHPGYDLNRHRERDVDVEKEIQRLKDELNKKDHELQSIRIQKAVDEEKIRDRDSNVRHLKEEIQALTTKITILDDRFLQMRSSNNTQIIPTHQQDNSVSALLKDNRELSTKIDKLQQLLQQAENDVKKEQKLKQRYERQIENLQQEVTNLKETIQLIERTHGNKNAMQDELLKCRNQYNEETLKRKALEEQVEILRKDLAALQSPGQGAAATNREPTTPHVDPAYIKPGSPAQKRPIQAVGIILADYCPLLSQRIKDNPKFLMKYRNEAKNELVEDYEHLGITETDTRLTDLDFRTKMERVLETRRIIQTELPNFERIRADITRILDQRVRERLDLRQSITSNRSTGSKIVSFEDEKRRSKNPSPKHDKTSTNIDQRPTTAKHPSNLKVDHSRPAMKADSDDDVSISNATESEEDTQPTRPGVTSNIKPPPRTIVPSVKPTSGINALVTPNIRPSKVNELPTISALPRQHLPNSTPTTNVSNFDSDSENESPAPKAPTSKYEPIQPNVNEKKRIIEQKLQEASTKGNKPTPNAVSQGFVPTHEVPVTKQYDSDDHNDSDESLTTLHTQAASQKVANGHLQQNSGRESMNNNLLSSGEASQFTYESLWKSQAGRGAELRRPQTADSAKTSNMDSDDNQEEEESN